MNPEIIVVCGIGRCGSSLTMQMLNAAGISCNGRPPPFEDERAGLVRQDPKWLTKQQGKATKVLMPYLFKFLPANYKFIWLDRNPLEQAKSAFKFAHIIIAPVSGIKIPRTGKPIVKMTKAYPHDKKKAFKQMRKFGSILELTFEDSIVFPKKNAALIADYLGLDLDIDAMASVVRHRTTDCSLNMDIELALMNEAR